VAGDGKADGVEMRQCALEESLRVDGAAGAGDGDDEGVSHCQVFRYSGVQVFGL
jgi:hypothetical protein